MGKWPELTRRSPWESHKLARAPVLNASVDSEGSSAVLHRQWPASRVKRFGCRKESGRPQDLPPRGAPFADSNAGRRSWRRDDPDRA